MQHLLVHHSLSPPWKSAHVGVTRCGVALSQGGALLREHASNILPGLSELVARDSTDNALRVSVMHMLAEIVHGACATHDDATAIAAMLQLLCEYYVLQQIQPSYDSYPLYLQLK